MPDFQIDVCPAHHVIRLTVNAETVTLEMAEEMYRQLVEVTSEGGPYAAIFDLSEVKHTTIPTGRVRSFGRHESAAVPQGVCPFCGHPRKQVVVGTEPAIFGLARVFEMCADPIGKEFQVVHTIEEAYEIVETKAEDFTECLSVEESVEERNYPSWARGLLGV